MKRLLVALTGLAVLAAPGRGYGQAAAAASEYDVTAEAGPWMVLIHSYRGDQAAALAHEFVLYLRTRHGLPAYIFNHGADQRRLQELDLERQRQQQRQFLQDIGAAADTPLRLRKIRIDEECAVLVGGYKDIDAAHDALERIKKLPPPPERLMDKLVTARVQPAPNSGDRVENPSVNPFVTGTPAVQPAPNAGGQVATASVNPFVTSFVVHNPRVPLEKQTNKPDPFWKELNADESYSLLKCPKPWTLWVKNFQGATVIQSHAAPTALLEKLLGQNSADYLDASAKQAHEVAKVLREHMNYEAYVLHTRTGSLVTVGGYDSPNDPQLLQNQRALANLRLGPVVQFFPTPWPMQVPRP